MVYKDKEKGKEYRKNYYKKYFRDNEEAREKNKLIRKRTYWRIKYCIVTKIKYEDFKLNERLMKLNIEQLQKKCNK